LCETAGSGKKKAGNDIAHRGPYEPNRGKRIKIGSAIFESLAFPRTSSRRLEVSTFVGRDSSMLTSGVRNGNLTVDDTPMPYQSFGTREK
jgi:hypothetical protein